MAKLGLIVAVLAIAGCNALPKVSVPSDFFYNQFEVESRLVGATVAPEGSAPYMVALTNGLLIRSFFCGGSIISQRHVLTAAHCIDAIFSRGSLSSSARAVIGTNRWNSGGIAHSFTGNITHPNWLPSLIKNDIGVLITTTNIAFNDRVQPIGLDYNFIDGGVVARTAGWGRTVAGGAISSQLLELYPITISGQECVAEVERNSNLLSMTAPPVEPHIEICTYHSVNRGNCNGDSGSALVALHTNLQIGVVSWGFPCARGVPDMFARISGYTSWLQGILN